MNSSEMKALAEQFGMEGTNIHAIRRAVVSQTFQQNKKNRALILIAPYPFLVIGKIKKVESDYLVIEGEVTNINELDGETFRIHIDEIEVFYIERDGKPIPDIRDGKYD
ncbi:hypothetical protein R4Z10_17475 [Niallia sp. XMNu-256]|uniref:hypothetical protein n=1 Tax=Niallia sp. XMNu-256 TaxID=3082444 RepID=UPI0030CCCF41